ncbi:MAG: 5-dehydro-4-deoxy-D-glucuronate isomerase [Bacteroidota bacterium]|nr:5-dehydro-4-deoxy-D-glucuronate isomerase [Bacteroidota bacterium]MDP4190542.1 5-dehydro-4-deoxy-D-glucuronate isomerase [Bacteroidota bacterium]MDP4193655.1 5-dehydro-4-deoxy-D-glucuronate isomerase [Bacteroidota bacterium]
MEIRYSMDPGNCLMADTEELRNTFLIDDLFAFDKVQMVYLDTDRAIIGSAVPVSNPLPLLSSKKEMASEYFTERRELGIINIGAKGIVIADGKIFQLDFKDALYIGKGTKQIEFSSLDKDDPALFYFASFPSHTTFPTALLKASDVRGTKIGSLKDSNKRTINKYIYPNGIKSCQLVMGLTELEEGSVWNTMPVHTHPRRSEIYMYFNLDKDSVVFHLMGEPGNTRHIVLRNRQAVISPSWSIHSGVATKNYSFIWAMGGENQDFDDMDWVKMEELF